MSLKWDWTRVGSSGEGRGGRDEGGEVASSTWDEWRWEEWEIRIEEWATERMEMASRGRGGVVASIDPDSKESDTKESLSNVVWSTFATMALGGSKNWDRQRQSWIAKCEMDSPNLQIPRPLRQDSGSFSLPPTHHSPHFPPSIHLSIPPPAAIRIG